MKKRGKRIQNGFSDFLHSKGLLFFWKRGQNDSPAFCRKKETKSFEKRPTNNPNLLPPKGETKTVQEGEHFRLPQVAITNWTLWLQNVPRTFRLTRRALSYSFRRGLLMSKGRFIVLYSFSKEL